MLGRVIAGTLGAGLTLVIAVPLCAWLRPALGAAVRSYLAGGGWLPLMLLGGAIGALGAVLRSARGRGSAIATAVALVVGAVLIGQRVGSGAAGETQPPRDARAKARAFLKWSYRSPGTVAMILPYTADPDPTVREQAVLALGINLIVTDIEHATPTRPARYLHSPVRDSLRARLWAALQSDPSEAVRAEAARGLWKAPLAFGPAPAAAETLAVVLDRTPRAGKAARTTWLALDAAAGAPNSRLRAAAARFAASTSDTALARVARMAARP